MTDVNSKSSRIRNRSDSALVRQWRLIKLLGVRRLGLSVKQIRVELLVSEKTARRDLIALREAGFPIHEHVGEFGRKTWRIDPQRLAPDLNFNFEEAVVLYLGRRLLQPLSGTVLGEASQSASRKIRAALSDLTVRYLDRIAGNLDAVLPATLPANGEVLDAIFVGIEDAKVVFITYQSQRSTEPVTYDIHPYAIALYKSSVYVIGYAPQHQSIRHWKLSRIERAEVDQMPFRRPDDFDLRKHLQGSFGIYQASGSVSVKVRFASAVARYVRETRWHESQTLQKQSDGSVLASFQLSSVTEIRQWLLSFGRHAEVLEPETLRQEMRDDATAILQLYSPQPATTPQPRAQDSTRALKRTSRSK